jgi:dihydrofolate reductase
MRKLIEATFVSLDGIVESPEKWALPYFAEENKRAALAALADVDAFLLGRVTYEEFAATWSKIEGDPYFDRINALPKFVPSTTLDRATWNARILKGDAAEEVARLKQQPGKTIMKYGTGQLDRVLFEHHLVDELHLSVFPIVVGSGHRLFEGFDATELELLATETFRNGVVHLAYRPR